MVDLTKVEEARTWHLFKPCESGRELVFGPQVPEDEMWVLTSMHAKNNQDIARKHLGRVTPEINVAVYDGEEWLCLASVADAAQFEGAAWSGNILMGPGWQLGTWFRGAKEGDTLQSDATYHKLAVTS
ncbi:MAG: hypothetical protein ACE5I2_09955 [Anaerolineae bacterium]